MLDLTPAQGDLEPIETASREARSRESIASALRRATITASSMPRG